MNLRPLRYNETAASHPAEIKISVYDLQVWSENWVFDARYRQFSKNTILNHEGIHKKLSWFLKEHRITEVDAMVLRRFLSYLSEPHARWGNQSHVACQRPASRRTVETYYGTLCAFFNWCVRQNLIEVSPMAALERPLKSRRKIYPFEDNELRALINATKKTQFPLRDNATVHFLLGTGVRVSEYCNVRYADINWDYKSLRVIGKGDKERVIHFGAHTQRLLWTYAQSRGHIAGDDLLFVGKGSQPFKRSGVTHLISRLGRLAGLKRERICPHTFRHTFAVNFLRAGGNVFTLKELLGHESLEMTNRYVQFAQVDISGQHQKFAPDDALYR